MRHSVNRPPTPEAADEHQEREPTGLYFTRFCNLRQPFVWARRTCKTTFRNDRLLFFEHARKTAEAAYAQNPLDAENLTRWGGALLELSLFQSVTDSKKLINEAISKLEEALAVNPEKHETLWCIGNAHTSFAFLTPDQDEAKDYFKKASGYFEQAVALHPTNELYAKSLEVAAKAPELHMEIHKSSLAQEVTATGPSTSAGGLKSSKKKKSNGFTYDVLGWVILAVGLAAWVGFAKSHMPAPPPSPR